MSKETINDQVGIIIMMLQFRHLFHQPILLLFYVSHLKKILNRLIITNL